LSTTPDDGFHAWEPFGIVRFTPCKSEIGCLVCSNKKTALSLLRGCAVIISVFYDYKRILHKVCDRVPFPPEKARLIFTILKKERIYLKKLQ
jgi:hypothetical protein